MQPDSCPTVSSLDGETPLGTTFPVTAAVFTVMVTVHTIADAVKLREAAWETVQDTRYRIPDLQAASLPFMLKCCEDAKSRY